MIEASGVMVARHIVARASFGCINTAPAAMATRTISTFCMDLGRWCWPRLPGGVLPDA